MLEGSSNSTDVEDNIDVLENYIQLNKEKD